MTATTFAVCVRDIPHQQFISEFAEHLKKSESFKVPKWVDIVKTGTSRELPPSNPDWFYVRAAALARHIYLNPNTGVGALVRLHGSKKNKGHRPGKHTDASGSVVRKALQSLEQMKMLEQSRTGGRRITVDGQRDMDRVAVLCASKYARPALLWAINKITISIQINTKDCKLNTNFNLQFLIGSNLADYCIQVYYYWILIQ